MMITPAHAIRGEITVPGDKSISHRAILLASLASGESSICNFLNSDDCQSTISCFQKLGIQIDQTDNEVRVFGRGMRGLRLPTETLYTGNSGTTMRLLIGLLAPQTFNCVLDGDEFIRRRPMARVVTPLKKMGARISVRDDGLCPLKIIGTPLHGIDYTLPVASAQLKSALILAGLYAEGETVIRERIPSRNHTENMLRALGANIKIDSLTSHIRQTEEIRNFDLTVPGDISSAAFFMVAALILPNSEITLRHVGINPTRRGVIDVLTRMGADIALTNEKNDLEPTADITVRSSSLHGCDIAGDIIPNIIDELPILAVAAAYAKGKTVIRDASELKHKESNRISAMVSELTKSGADLAETDDGMIIYGGKPLHGAEINSYHDHRIAMSMAVCALAADTPSSLHGADCIAISYPKFFSDVRRCCI